MAELDAAVSPGRVRPAVAQRRWTLRDARNSADPSELREGGGTAHTIDGPGRAEQRAVQA